MGVLLSSLVACLAESTSKLDPHNRMDRRRIVRADSCLHLSDGSSHVILPFATHTWRTTCGCRYCSSSCSQRSQRRRSTGLDIERSRRCRCGGGGGRGRNKLCALFLIPFYQIPFDDAVEPIAEVGHEEHAIRQWYCQYAILHRRAVRCGTVECPADGRCLFVFAL